jgi:uncharacterized protein YprB with RNaseH-like and TPR domain
MNLRDTLDRYFKADGAQADVPGSSAVAQGAAPAHCEHIHHLFPPHHEHGSFPVANLEGRFSNAVELLLRQALSGSVDFKRIAFIDTETTGLSGGIGVCAFLVGIGFFSSDGFAVEQFLMYDYPAERSMLEKVCEKLASFEAIASFNGRSFDVPILGGRLVLNGIRNALGQKPHLDVLHPVRRLWKHRLNDCSLKSIEASVLQFAREGDIEGWMIPQAYFSFLRTQNRDVMERILHHNRLDLLSLACITNLTLRAIDSPQKAPLEHGEDWFGLGTFFNTYHRTEEAVHCFERAMQAGLPLSLQKTCRRMLSLTHKRAGDWDNAVRLWEETSASSNGDATIFELEELAKYYEHRLRDLTLARGICRRAITMLEIKAALSKEETAEHLAQFECRLRRIERKLQREKICAKQSSQRPFFS